MVKVPDPVGADDQLELVELDLGADRQVKAQARGKGGKALEAS